MMTRLAMIVAIVACLATSAGAQPPTTRPAHEGGRRMGPRKLSDEDRQAAIAFARENMPNLYALIENTTPGDPRRGRLIGLAYRRYRDSQMHRDNPELKQSMQARLQSEDELFELIVKWRQAPEDDKLAVREQLLEKVRVFVVGWLDDRQRRLDALKRQIDREQTQLEQDQENVEKLAERHMDMLMGDLRDPMMMPPDIRDDLSPSSGPGDRPRRRDDRK